MRGAFWGEQTHTPKSRKYSSGQNQTKREAGFFPWCLKGCGLRYLGEKLISSQFCFDICVCVCVCACARICYVCRVISTTEVRAADEEATETSGKDRVLGKRPHLLLATSFCNETRFS